MKYKIAHSIIVGVLMLISIQLSAQEVVNPRATAPRSKWERRFPTIKVGNKMYKTGSNYLTVSMGPAYSTTLKRQELSMALGYHMRYKPIYFKIGYHYSDDKFFMSNRLRDASYHNELITAVGFRRELIHFSFAFFIGPSFVYGYTENPENNKLATWYSGVGVVPEIQLTYKFLYDLGIGTSLYGTFNKHYQAVGVRLHFYFSGAYRGKY